MAYCVRGTGCQLYHPGWLTDTASPAAAEPAGCGIWWDFPGGSGPKWQSRKRYTTLVLDLFFD